MWETDWSTCPCRRRRRCRRCGVALRYVSCRCTSWWRGWCRWGTSCRGWWPRRRDRSRSAIAISSFNSERERVGDLFEWIHIEWTYVDELVAVASPQVVKDGGVVEVSQVGHVLGFFVFGRVHLLQLVFLEGPLLFRSSPTTSFSSIPVQFSIIINNYIIFD